MRRGQQLTSLRFRRRARGAHCLLLLGACASSGTQPSVTSRPSPAAAPTALQGPAPAAAPAALPSAASPGWLTTSKPDLRALTVVVRSNPPAALQSKFRELAVRYRP